MMRQNEAQTTFKAVIADQAQKNFGCHKEEWSMPPRKLSPHRNRDFSTN